MVFNPCGIVVVDVVVVVVVVVVVDGPSVNVTGTCDDVVGDNVMNEKMNKSDVTQSSRDRRKKMASTKTSSIVSLSHQHRGGRWRFWFFCDDDFMLLLYRTNDDD